MCYYAMKLIPKTPFSKEAVEVAIRITPYRTIDAAKKAVVKNSIVGMVRDHKRACVWVHGDKWLT